MNEINWRRSTRCGESGHCVQVAITSKAVHVRDCKDTDGPILVFGRDEWTAFLAGAKAGEFNL